MKSYVQRLRDEINDIKKAFPFLESLISKIKEIDNLSSKEFDNNTEREWRFYNEAFKILSNEREGDRKHEQNEKPCLKHLQGRCSVLPSPSICNGCSEYE